MDFIFVKKPCSDFIFVKKTLLGSYICEEKKPCSDGEINARLLVLVHVVLKLCLAQLVEGDDDQGNKDVDKEEGKDNEEDDVED